MKAETIVGIGLAAAVILILVSKPKKAKAALIKRVVVDGGKVSSSYLRYRGKRKEGTKAFEKHGEDIYHQGLDIKAPKNTPIRSVSNGVVLVIWPDGRVSGYGNAIVISNDDGTGALNAHMNKFMPNLKVGDKVKQEQQIGYVGSTQSPRAPMRTAPHLHLEIHKYATKAINPSHPPRLSPIKYIASKGISVGGIATV